MDDDEVRTEQIIDRLFPDAPLLCCGKSESDFDTKPREDWRGELSRLQFIVPSAMSAIAGRTKGGRESKHTLENTAPRRYLVCEFDSGDVDDHAALLIHLGGYAPLVCAVHSGGKSLHGWFFCTGVKAEKVWRFFRYAVSLGADSITWTPSQFVRMPDGPRGNGKQFTPSAVKSTFATGLTGPRGLAFDSAGNLFVAEIPLSGPGDILKITPGGTRTVFASGFSGVPEYLAIQP
jgi:hypothetical protein